MLLLEKQNNQIDKLIKLMGADKLDEQMQQNVKTCLMGIIVEDNYERLKSLFKVLYQKIGADKLSEDAQGDLTERLLMICQYIRDGKEANINEVMRAADFKWNNYSTPVENLNEVKKSDFKWRKNQGSIFGIDEGRSTEKINKNQYRWGPDSNSMGSTIKSGGII